MSDFLDAVKFFVLGFAAGWLYSLIKPQLVSIYKGLKSLPVDWKRK